MSADGKAMIARVNEACAKLHEAVASLSGDAATNASIAGAGALFEHATVMLAAAIYDGDLRGADTSKLAKIGVSALKHAMREIYAAAGAGQVPS